MRAHRDHKFNAEYHFLISLNDENIVVVNFFSLHLHFISRYLFFLICKLSAPRPTPYVYAYIVLFGLLCLRSVYVIWQSCKFDGSLPKFFFLSIQYGSMSTSHHLITHSRSPGPNAMHFSRFSLFTSEWKIIKKKKQKSNWRPPPRHLWLRFLDGYHCIYSHTVWLMLLKRSRCLPHSWLFELRRTNG